MRELKTHVVTADDDGVRPTSGITDACLYCKAKIGEEHRLDCVILKRPVKLSVTITFEIEEDLPQSWNKEQIEFARNESSWCASSLIDRLTDLDEREGCICWNTKIEYLGEGTPKETPNG